MRRGELRNIAFANVLDYLKINPVPSEDEIRDAISAVLCRCTGYVNIVKAIKAGAEAMRRESDRSAP